MNSKPCIGLFGTCGGSKWRDPFIATYESINISYFNPQVEDWDPSMAEIEAEHLANDEIILFPVTGETYATGSLSEIGFSILNAIKLDDRRDFIIMVSPDLDDNLKENVVAYKESVRSRALVKQHLAKLRLGNLYLVDTLIEMLTISIDLYETAIVRKRLQCYNPHRKEIK